LDSADTTLGERLDLRSPFVRVRRLRKEDKRVGAERIASWNRAAPEPLSADADKSQHVDEKAVGTTREGGVPTSVPSLAGRRIYEVKLAKG
jgi:hypothetical protein